jgi:hypothetical protein
MTVTRRGQPQRAQNPAYRRASHFFWLLVAINLVANYAINTPANGYFFLKKSIKKAF